MSIHAVLQQLLQSGRGLAGEVGGQLGQNRSGGSASAMGGMGGGLLAGGALGLLLGNKRFRQLGGTLAAYGGAAALGAVAYRAYQDWQAGKAAAATVSPAAAAALPAPSWSDGAREEHSRAILAAMVGAAKADGHIGDAERQLLEAEFARLSNDPADRRWLESELARPADPAAVARLAQSGEMAAEIYLASALVIDEAGFMERAYLDELARQLSLAPELKQTLDTQVGALPAASGG